MHTYKGEQIRTDLLQDAKPPEVLQFITVAKTRQAKRALQQNRRDFETIKGYIRFRTSASERSKMEKGKLTRLGVLRNLGVY